MIYVYDIQIKHTLVRWNPFRWLTFSLMEFFIDTINTHHSNRLLEHHPTLSRDNKLYQFYSTPLFDAHEAHSYIGASPLQRHHRHVSSLISKRNTRQS